MFKPFAPHMVDGYKLGHASMYTVGTDFLYSNLTPRSDKYFKGSRLYDGKLVVFGAQGAIQEIVELWNESFFAKPKAKVIARYKRRLDGYLGKDVVSTERMAELHDLGFLPLEIKTISEGSRIKMKIPMLTIKSTNPKFFWLVNYLETILSNMIWKGTTNATIGYEYKRVAADYAIRTGSAVETVLFQIHGFEMRGMSGPEDASRSGAGPLATGLLGTDTVGAIDYIEDYYNPANDPLVDDYMIAGSIPATEHAVSSSNIITRKARYEAQGIVGDTRLLAEAEFMLDYITRQNPTGFCSYVADTYDYWGVLTKVLTMEKVKAAIMAREGRLVIRPDSGDPIQVICGQIDDVFATLDEAVSEINDRHYSDAAEACEGSHCMGLDEYESLVYITEEAKYYTLKTTFSYNRHDKQYYYVDNWGSDGDTTSEETQPTVEQKGSIQLLWEIFGGTVNEKGFKVLDSHIGLIYGDSITLAREEEIFRRLEKLGFASCNVVFGVGSYTYQMNSRDTFGTAMKATATGVDGDFFEIYEDPATGDKLKKSAVGLLFVGKDENGEFYLEDRVSAEKEQTGELITRFKDGVFFNLESIDTIRQRLA